MAERGLSPDHSTIARWVLRYAPILRETTFDFSIRMMPSGMVAGQVCAEGSAWEDASNVHSGGKWREGCHAEGHARRAAPCDERRSRSKRQASHTGDGIELKPSRFLELRFGSASLSAHGLSC